jgi:hypothetical protein
MLVFLGSRRLVLAGGNMDGNMADDDIPPTVRDRPFFASLSPAEEEEFLRQQAEYEAAWHRTGDPEVLWNALLHVWGSRQTVPGWLVPEIGVVLMRNRTPQEIRRYRERMRKVRRYIIVRNLRRKYTKDVALDRAVAMLAGEPASPQRETIERDYDDVRKDLERRGRDSEFFYLVELVDRNGVNPLHAESLLPPHAGR